MKFEISQWWRSRVTDFRLKLLTIKVFKFLWLPFENINFEGLHSNGLVSLVQKLRVWQFYFLRFKMWFFITLQTGHFVLDQWWFLEIDQQIFKSLNNDVLVWSYFIKKWAPFRRIWTLLEKNNFKNSLTYKVDFC